MTTYEVTSPKLAERYFEQSLVGDVSAFIMATARKVREFAGVVGHYTRLAQRADTRR